MPDNDNREIIDAEEVSHEDVSAKKAEAMRNLQQFKETLEQVKARAEQVRAAQDQAIAQGGMSVSNAGGFARSTYPVEGLLNLLESEGIVYKVTKTVPAQPQYDTVTILLKDVEAADKLAIERWRASQQRPPQLVPESVINNTVNTSEAKADKETETK